MSSNLLAIAFSGDHAVLDSCYLKGFRVIRSSFIAFVSFSPYENHVPYLDGFRFSMSLGVSVLFHALFLALVMLTHGAVTCVRLRRNFW